VARSSPSSSRTASSASCTTEPSWPPIPEPSSRRSPAAAQAATSTTTPRARVKHHPTTIRKASAQASHIPVYAVSCDGRCATRPPGDLRQSKARSAAQDEVMWYMAFPEVTGRAAARYPEGAQ
jgi:hypothetical protein